MDGRQEAMRADFPKAVWTDLIIMNAHARATKEL